MLAAAATLLLTACGTTEQPAGPEGPAAITLVDDRGTTIELPGPATDVVALEWNAVENLVALGVMPVGVADPTQYAIYVHSTPLDADVVDVGLRGEPSIDAIAGLSPDLVIATNDLDESAISQIERFAPVLVLRGADASNGIGQMTANLTAIATATGRTDQAAELVTAFEEKLAAGKTALAARAGERFALSDAFAYGGQIYIRPYLTGSLLSDVTERMGLVNGWPGTGDADYGLGQSDVEGLTVLPDDVHFIYLGGSEQDVYANELADHPVWTSLPFVTGGHVHRLHDGIWPFGGPSSMIDYIDAVVDALG
jgi:iron complex transport system substrate-binding protein